MTADLQKSPRWPRWAAVLCIVVIVGCLAVYWFGQQSAEPSLQATLTASLIRSGKGPDKRFPVDEEGVLPARPGDHLHLQVEYYWFSGVQLLSGGPGNLALSLCIQAIANGHPHVHSNRSRR